ncbi:hypothetical protein I4U23_023400 [Adineta vaga]|nr:hypothetical protein I4U23_023400 [Adineta vaga]
MFIGSRIQNASAPSFEALSDYYAKDSWNVFYKKEKLRDALASSFQVIDFGRAKDSSNNYSGGHKLSNF